MPPHREVRLALVLNGGVSLAVWIGGVVQEVDAARRAAGNGANEGTGALYAELLRLLRQSLVVDVISGASAGGINGVLLASAIYNGRRLPALRDVWLEIGDFERLLRPLPARDARSLMDGDGVVFEMLHRIIAELFENHAERTRRPLYLYVSATDLFGFPQRYADSAGRTFWEREHRRICAFQHEPGDEWRRRPPRGDALGVVRSPVRFGDPDAGLLLAGAARSSSSFPVAFETHALRFEEQPGIFSEPRAMVDGGVLDNQPFGPVLDRIAVLPAGQPVKRVLAYVVPYVTERAETDARAEGSALDAYNASGGLPRDLPRLQSLNRLTRELVDLDADRVARHRIRTVPQRNDLADAADRLFETYRWTRFAMAASVHELWADPAFRPGNGPWGNDPTQPPRLRSATDAAPSRPGQRAPSRPWIPDAPNWDRAARGWQWGLPAAERTAAWALLMVRDVAASASGDDATGRLLATRLSAGRLLWAIRRSKEEIEIAFREAGPGEPDARARAAYAARQDHLESIQRGFRLLDARLARVNAALPKAAALPTVRDLFHLEIVRHALVTDDLGVAFPFSFLYASAGIGNALGHAAATPAAKLAGMKLDHFGGFAKRSWRANDWLWGRLDGVEHLLSALLDLDRLAELRRTDPDLPSKLGALALPLADPAHGDPVAAVADAADTGRTPAARTAALDRYRRALGARIQMQVLRDELHVVADAALRDLREGGSPEASTAGWLRTVVTRDGAPRSLSDAELREAFLALRAGSEPLRGEAFTPRALLVAAHAVRVAADVFEGAGGGVPDVVRTRLRPAFAPLVAAAAASPAVLVPWRLALRLWLRLRPPRAPRP